MTWHTQGKEIYCDICGKRFAVGHSCDCRPENQPAPAIVDLTPPVSLPKIVPQAEELLTVEGAKRRLAEIAVKVRGTKKDIGIKRYKEERLTLSAIIDACTKGETAERLAEAERRLATVEGLLGGKGGGAQRLDQSPEDVQ